MGTAEVLAIVAADHPQLSVEPLSNLGERALSAVTFDAIPLADVTVLADGAAVAELLDIVAQRAAVLQAAEVYGAGLELLARTVRYAKERQQFGTPIGRFQAVQYLCTDIALAVHLTSVFTRHAAALLDDGHPAGVAVAMMRTQASRAARTMVHSRMRCMPASATWNRRSYIYSPGPLNTGNSLSATSTPTIGQSRQASGPPRVPTAEKTLQKHC